jgi:hypothetical protein
MSDSFEDQNPRQSYGYSLSSSQWDRTPDASHDDNYYTSHSFRPAGALEPISPDFDKWDREIEAITFGADLVGIEEAFISVHENTGGINQMLLLQEKCIKFIIGQELIDQMRKYYTSDYPALPSDEIELRLSLDLIGRVTYISHADVPDESYCRMSNLDLAIMARNHPALTEDQRTEFFKRSRQRAMRLVVEGNFDEFSDLLFGSAQGDSAQDRAGWDR